MSGLDKPSRSSSHLEQAPFFQESDALGLAEGVATQVGMIGEYPYLCHRGDFPDVGYDGVIEPGMVMRVESYIGEESGSQGVKLE